MTFYDLIGELVGSALAPRFNSAPTGWKTLPLNVRELRPKRKPETQ